VSSAPIDVAAVAASLKPFGESIGLPGEAYTSPDVFAWEMDHFFDAGWVCAGRQEEIPAEGDRIAVRVGLESALVVRQGGDAIQAFFNVCRHRGHELLEVGSRATGERLQCPYHAWSYALDGRLRSAPRLGPRPDFDPQNHALTPLRTEVLEGWIFVNASGEAPALREYLGNLVPLLRPHRPASLLVGARTDYVVHANWKLVGENYHECYHCESIHPELCLVTPPDSGANYRPDGAWVGGSMELRPEAETMSLTGKSAGGPLPGLDASQRRLVYYVGVFPNLYISAHPDYVLTHRVEPLAPDRSRVICEWLFPPEVLQRPGFDPSYATDFWDVTNKQDWHAIESVQRGVSSRAFRPGPISRPEDAVYQFISLVAQGYRDGRALRPIPAAR
jgi:Rieske 2Fe-2S family protein